MAIVENHTMYVSGYSSGKRIQKLTLSNGEVTSSDDSFSTGWDEEVGPLVIGPDGKLYAQTYNNKTD